MVRYLDVLSDILAEHASSKRILRRNGYVWKPIHNCPCAYEKSLPYGEFVDSVLYDNLHYRRSAHAQDTLVTILRNKSLDGFPITFEEDQNILSFQNGILKLDTLQFIRYDSDEFKMYDGIVARNHIHMQFTATEECPSFEKILDHQLTHPEKEMVYFMIGRFLYPMNKYDSIHRIPFFYGGTCTGKNTIVRVISAMFNWHASVEIADCNLKKCSRKLESRYLVVNTYIPAKLSKWIAAADFVSFAKGELCGGHMVMSGFRSFDYYERVKDHLLVFNMLKTVPRTEVIGGLDDEIIKTELANIIWKSVNMYRKLIDINRDIPFESWCPSKLFDLTAVVI